MEQKIAIIRSWLGNGSINVFGLPYSGKDTVGIRLAELLGAKLLSSGFILRAAEKEDSILAKELSNGNLVATQTFRDIILPYFGRDELKGVPLILSSVGRWEGEEFPVMEAAKNADHEIKAVILLNISEEEAQKRWDVAKTLGDRGDRSDDREKNVLETRFKEFREKTMPVIEIYHKMGILLPVQATGPREEVFENVIDSLVKLAQSAQ